MDTHTDSELCSAEAGPRHPPGLVSAEFQSSNVNLAIGTGPSTSLSHSGIPAPSNRESYHHLHHHGFKYRNQDNDDHHDHMAQSRNQHQPHLHSESLTMPDTLTQSTSFSGPSSLSEAHTSGLDPAELPPIGTVKPSHRNPYQHSRSHPNLVSSNLQHNPLDTKFQKPRGEASFSPPFLHPLSLRTSSGSSRTFSPHPASARRYRSGQKSKTRFTVGSSPPNSPLGLGPKRGSSPARPASPFTVRGFLALSTFTKVVAILFACCVFVLFKAFLGVGHSAESCGVYAHEVTDPSPRSRSTSGSVGARLDENDPRVRTKDWVLLDQRVEDDQAGVWLEGVEEMYGYQYDWKSGEYEIEHDGDGDDRYGDEYEHEDFLDPVYT